MEQQLRKTIKHSAKWALRGNWSAAIALTLLLLACTVGLSLLEEGTEYLLGLEQYFDYLGTPEVYLDDLAAVSLLTIAVTSAFALLSFLFLVPLKLAKRRWYFRLGDGQAAPVAEAFYYFGSPRRYLRALHLAFALFWRVALMGVLLYLPGGVVLTGGVIAAGMRVVFPLQRLYAFIWVLCGILLLLTATVLLLLFMARYFAAPYLVAAKHMKVSQAIRLSRACMRGRAGQWLELNLSFLGWFILNIFVAPLLYTAPYYETTLAIYAKYRIESYELQQEAATAEFTTQTAPRPAESEEIEPERPAETEWPADAAVSPEPVWNFKDQPPVSTPEDTEDRPTKREAEAMAVPEEALPEEEPAPMPEEPLE